MKRLISSVEKSLIRGLVERRDKREAEGRANKRTMITLVKKDELSRCPLVKVIKNKKERGGRRREGQGDEAGRLAVGNRRRKIEC